MLPSKKRHRFSVPRKCHGLCDLVPIVCRREFLVKRLLIPMCLRFDLVRTRHITGCAIYHYRYEFTLLIAPGYTWKPVKWYSFLNSEGRLDIFPPVPNTNAGIIYSRPVDSILYRMHARVTIFAGTDFIDGSARNEMAFMKDEQTSIR